MKAISGNKVNEAQIYNPFPNKPWFLGVCCTTLLKTLLEKEKLLVTSNFSFSHSVFYLFEEFYAISMEYKIVIIKLFQIGRVKHLSFGKGLNLFGLVGWLYLGLMPL